MKTSFSKIQNIEINLNILFGFYLFSSFTVEVVKDSDQKLPKRKCNCTKEYFVILFFISNLAWQSGNMARFRFRAVYSVSDNVVQFNPAGSAGAVTC